MPLFWKPLANLTWRTALLMVGISFGGWWLAALAIPPAMALGTGLVLAYLIVVGLGGTVPAMAWVSMLIALVVAFDRFPPFWPGDSQYKYWAFTILLVWALSSGVVYLLALQGQSLHQMPSNYRWLGQLLLLGTVILALHAGAWLYGMEWPGLIDWPP
jgi:hypothetical protein